MDFLRTIFNNPKGAVVLIILVILLFAAYKQAGATEMELGATYTSRFNGGGSLGIVERLGPVDVGLTLVGQQSWEAVNLDNNAVVWGAFVAERPSNWFKALPSEVSIGTGYWFRNDYSPVSDCHPTFLLGLKWRFGDASIGIRHFSNAGICDKNRGQDILTFGWRFQ